MNYFKHESSYVDDGAIIGEGTKIWHFSHIMSGAQIGNNCSIGQNVNVGSRAVIGNGVKIQNNVSVYDDVIIEDDVFCGPSCVFTNVINPRAFVERKHEYKKTVVKKGASIGANATIVCGVIIGEYALVGAGSVVTKDVAPYSLVYGTPARVMGKVDMEGNKVSL
jgi:UDP-2-acetamido-3-amino-2,3-dideoxy-glucuronate N-acetyltransferase